MLCISTMATMDEPDTHYNMFFCTVTEQEVDKFLSSHTTIQLYNFALSSIKRYKEEIQGVNSEYCRKHSQLVARRGEDLKKFDVEKEKLKKKLEESEVIEVELFQENDRLIEENQKLKKELESLKQFELDRILDASMNEIFTTERQFLRESMIL